MKKIFFNFIRDKISTTLVYFINTVIIILFFYLYVDKKIPILYPIVLSTSIYMVFYIYEFCIYYKFNKNIEDALENTNIGKIYAKDYQQKRVKDLFYRMRESYMYNINSMKEENKINNKFFSQWIHNMKTPVSIIEIIVQKILEKISCKCVREDSAEFLTIYNWSEEIREENKKLLDGLNQILNMIRIEDFAKDYVPEIINLYDSLKKVINEQKNVFIHNNIFPKISCENTNYKILTDKKWNEFMMGQIISNAIKYSRGEDQDKKLSKFVYFSILKKDGQTVLTIRDEGIGIPSYDISRIFEAFFTGTNGRKEKQSTGIGLYICKVICEKLGHEISIKTQVEKGTEVQIKYLSKM